MTIRVLIIADDSFAARERALLTRLEVGLADEGVQVVHAIPRSASHWYQPEVFTQAVLYESRGLAISRRWRAARLLEAVGKGAAGEERRVDLVHAFGRGAWGIAADITRDADAALAIEITGAADAGECTRRRISAGRQPTVYLIPDPVLERPVRDGDVGIHVRLTPWGVHTPPQASEIFPESRGPSFMLIGPGRDGAAWMAVLESLSALAKESRDFMVFADADAVHATGIWSSVRGLGLAPRFTLIPELEARRELTLRADAIVIPEASGEQRSLVLDAMAGGTLVIAAADPLVSILQPGGHALLVDRPASEAWTDAIRWVFENPGAARELAAAARENIRLNCRASSHVQAVVGAYEWMLSGESIPFGAARNVR